MKTLKAMYVWFVAFVAIVVTQVATARERLHGWADRNLVSVPSRFGQAGAVVTTKSTAITNRDATPAVITDGRLERASMRSCIGSVLAVNGDSIGSKYILASVPSTAMVRKVLLSCVAITSGAGDIGVYRNTKDGGAVVDADFFASAQSIASILNNSDVTNESTIYTIDKREMPLWQAAGLTADPQTTLDIAITLTAATTAGGLVGAQVEYVDNGS